MISKLELVDAKSILGKLNVNEYSAFTIFNNDFLYFPCQYTQEEREDERPVVFWRTSQVGDFDIYLGENVIEPGFRRPVLLHECLESILRKTHDWKSAHKIAERYDIRYAKEILSKFDFLEYLKLRRSLVDIMKGAQK